MLPVDGTHIQVIVRSHYELNGFLKISSRLSHLSFSSFARHNFSRTSFCFLPFFFHFVYSPHTKQNLSAYSINVVYILFRFGNFSSSTLRQTFLNGNALSSILHPFFIYRFSRTTKAKQKKTKHTHTRTNEAKKKCALCISYLWKSKRQQNQMVLKLCREQKNKILKCSHAFLHS